MLEQQKVKLVLNLPDNQKLFVAGKSGRINLVGGGKEPGESDFDTLFREAQEEIGLTPSMISNPGWLGGITGEVVGEGGNPVTGTWDVYCASLLAPLDSLTIGNEIATQHVMTAPVALADPRVVDMTKMALQLK